MPDPTIRPTTDADAGLLLSLAHECPPLDIHTPYTYWVLAHMFGTGCFVAYDGDSPIGFVTSVVEGDRALLWQVGVLQPRRGEGISHLLIDAVVESAKTTGLAAVELSIDPNNATSIGAFTSYARKRGLPFDRIGEVDLTDSSNPGFREFEDLYAIGLPS